MKEKGSYNLLSVKNKNYKKQKKLPKQLQSNVYSIN